MIPYYFTLAFSCLLMNKYWTCWISVHVWYDRFWSSTTWAYIVQSHVCFRTRDTSFTICFAQMMYIVISFCFVINDLIFLFPFFFLSTKLFEATWHVFYWSSQVVTIENFVRLLKLPLLLLLYRMLYFEPIIYIM